MKPGWYPVPKTYKCDKCGVRKLVELVKYPHRRDEYITEDHRLGERWVEETYWICFHCGSQEEERATHRTDLSLRLERLLSGKRRPRFEETPLEDDVEKLTPNRWMDRQVLCSHSQ